MTANYRKFYLSHLNKLVDQCNNTYHDSIGKKPIDADYSALTEETKSSYKTPKFKTGVESESELLSIRIFLVTVTLKIGQKNKLLSILCWKLILGHMDI